MTVDKRPTTTDQDEWKAYWKTQGQSWRTEPEIDAERQKYLAERRSINPNIEQGIYPFKDVKLSRADVEWLLATHENGRGPVDWSDPKQRTRKGLDLRGADLCRVNLSRLPLARLQAGLNESEGNNTTIQHISGVAASFEAASFNSAHLEGANLRGVSLWRADFRGTDLFGAYLEYAQLNSAFFDETSTLRYATLGSAKHKFASVADARWGGINLAVVKWPKTKRTKNLILGDEHVARRNTMYRKINDKETDIYAAQWRRIDGDGKINDKEIEIYKYERAVRANRQLANALQEQGLNELAAYFAYRGQILQRTVFRLQGGTRSFRQYLFSLFLDLLTGYGYKPLRSFIAYAVVISVFATIYFLLGSHLAWNEAIVISITAFHGRGFFPEQFKPGDPQALVAAIEAFVGLLIEVTFIATLTQRLFGK